MISKVSGTIGALYPTYVTIDTPSGLSYDIYCSSDYLTSMILGQSIGINVSLIVREDSWTLYGFPDSERKDLFFLVQTVSGVGAKTAFTIASHLSMTDAFKALQSQDIEVFSKISGVGKKTAAKIVLELSQKFKKDVELQKLLADQAVITSPLGEALQSLGFKKAELKGILEKVDQELPLEKQIAQALKELS